MVAWANSVAIQLKVSCLCCRTLFLSYDAIVSLDQWLMKLAFSIHGNAHYQLVVDVSISLDADQRLCSLHDIGMIDKFICWGRQLID